MGEYAKVGSDREFFENLKFLSTKEAADVLLLSENAIWIMVCRGQIKSFKLGSRLRFREKNCLALIHRNGA